jgi:hypothetical protein
MSRPEPSGLGATLRFELASEEGRPLFVSYLAASLLALSWLALVHLMPPLSRPVLGDGPIITFEPEMPPLPPSLGASSSGTGRGVRSVSPRVDSRGANSIRRMFSGNPGLVDAGQLLRGVEVTGAGTTAGEPGVPKVGLGTGVGSRTPGRSGSGGLSPTGSGVGAVRGEGLSRRAVTVAPPEVRPMADGVQRGDLAEVGQTARARAPQLERCYLAEGLTRNASLAGLVRLAITVESGRVTSARIVDRSWSGAGAAETESCLVRSARGWQLGNASAQLVLPLSFTSPATQRR